MVRIWSAGDQLPIYLSCIHTEGLEWSLTLQNVKADTTELVDVGVVYFREKPNFGRSHWVVIWKEQLKLKDPA